jgi:hypothetical protein
MRYLGRMIAIGVCLIAFAIGAYAQPSPASLGTWKLNPAKSKYSPGPGPKSLVVKFEASGKDGVKLTSDGVSADGKKSSGSYTAKYDGKDYPLTGSPVADTVSLRRIDANTMERTDKKNGKVVQTLTRTMAKDGKSFTVAVKGTNPKGQPISNLMVFEKQ